MAAPGDHEVVEPQQLDGGEKRHEVEDSPRLKRRRMQMSSLLSRMGAMATSQTSAPQVFTFAHGAATFNRFSVGVHESANEAAAKNVDEDRDNEESKKARPEPDRPRRFLGFLKKFHDAASSKSQALPNRCACGNEFLPDEKFCRLCGNRKETAEASTEPLNQALRSDIGNIPTETAAEQHGKPIKIGEADEETTQVWEFGAWNGGDMPTVAQLKELKVTCGQCLNERSKKGHRSFIKMGMVCYRYPDAQKFDGVRPTAPEKRTTPPDDPSILVATSLPVTPAVDLLGSNMNLEKMKKPDTEVAYAERVAVSPTLLCEPCVNPEVPELSGSLEMMEVQELVRSSRRVPRCKRCGGSGHYQKTCTAAMPHEQPELQHRDDSLGQDASELNEGDEPHTSNDGTRAVYWQCTVLGCDNAMHRIVYRDDPERRSKKAFHLKSHTGSAERPNEDAVSPAPNTPIEGDAEIAALENECVTPADRRKTCKLCGESGHNSRTCKKRQGADSVYPETVKKQRVDPLKTFQKRALNDRQHYLEEKDTGSLSRSSADTLQSKTHNERANSSAGISSADDSEDETIGALASQCKSSPKDDERIDVECSVLAETVARSAPSVSVPFGDRGTQEDKRIDVESSVLAETVAPTAPSVSVPVVDRGTRESVHDVIGKQSRSEPNIDVRVATLDELQLSAKPLVDLFAKQTFKEQREFVGVTGCTSSRRMCSLLRGVYTKMPSCVGGMPAYQKIRMKPLHADSFENLPVFILWHSKLACWIICDKPKATVSSYVYARTSPGHTTADAAGEWSVRNEKDTAVSFDQDSCLKVVALTGASQAD